MDYLENLKRQAEAARQDEVDHEAEARKAAENAKELEQALKQTYRFLKEMVQALTAAKPMVSVDYDVQGYGTLAGLVQQDYSLEKGDAEGTRTIALFFRCAAENAAPRTFKVEGHDACRRQRDYMWQHGLRFTDKVSADGVATFRLEPTVFVKLEFVPDVRLGKIKLVMSNFEFLGEMTRWIEPQRVKRETLDDLTALVLRKSTDLEHLTGGQISQEMRLRIQEGLKKEKEEQERLDRLAAAQAEEEERLLREQRLVNKARRKLDSLGRRAVDYVKGGGSASEES